MDGIALYCTICIDRFFLSSQTVPINRSCIIEFASYEALHATASLLYSVIEIRHPV